MKIERFIDHTLLKATATTSDILKLCKEAVKHNFYAICINSCHLTEAKEYLGNSDVKLAAVIGFPLGAMSTKAKLSEAQYCIEQGADEIDMVINLGWLKGGQHRKVMQEIKQIKEILGTKILKVIIESGYLSEQEKRTACKLILEAKGDFVKTSTGFGPGGATIKDVLLIKELVKDKAQIKASGGIKDKNTALQYIKLGVSRIGTSSGIAIVS